ncbi:MAG: glycosyltransferase family 4 protein [Caldilineaceae bacterium]
MRILMISWEFPPYVVGGIGTHVEQLVPCLGGLSTHDGPLVVDVLTTRAGGGDAVEVINEWITVYRVDVPATDATDLYNSIVDNNGVLVGFAQALTDHHTYDLIHVHDWLTAEAGLRLKHLWRKPLIVTIHATERGRHQGHLPSYTSQQIDNLEWRISFESWRVIACSDYMCREMNQQFRLPFDKMTIIPNGVAPPHDVACDPDSLDALRSRYAPNGEHLLFFVGRITHEKGVQILVRAMPRVLAAFPNTRLLVAGKNSQKLFPLAYELNVEANVDFLGYISNEMRDCLYAIVDAAVFPSLYEPFGIVALEAMAGNCNVIASDTGGLGEVVQHEVNGLTSLPGDPVSIAWAVERLFSDPAAAAQRRATASAQIRDLYRWDKIGAQTASLYDEVVAARKLVDW